MTVRFALPASVLTLAALSAAAAAQHRPAPAAGAAAHHGQGSIAKPTVHATRAGTVPFELYRGNRVFVAAVVNGRPVEALLDTGASITTLDRAYARSLGLPPGRKVHGRGAGGPVEAELVDGVSLEIGGVRFEKMTVGVMDFSGVSSHLGRPMPLIVGRELFNNAAIRFDWAAQRMTVTPMAAFTAPAGATSVAVERRGPFNFVKLAVAGLPAIDALLDLGNGGAVKLPSDYWLKQPALAALPYADNQSGGVGGLHATRAVTLPAIEFAGRRFERVPAVFGGDSQGGEAAHGANLGIGVLKQFDLTLDLGRDRIFVTPRAQSVPFDRDRAGVRVEPDGGALRVAFVSPQGPAAKAGIKSGDRITAINGAPVAANFHATAAGDWNRAAAGSPVALRLDDGRQVRFELTDYY